MYIFFRYEILCRVQVTRKLYFNDVIMVSSPLELKSNQFEASTDTIGLNRPCCSILFFAFCTQRSLLLLVIVRWVTFCS